MLGRTITVDVCGFPRSSSSSFQIYEHVWNGVLGVINAAGGFGCAHYVSLIQNRLLDSSHLELIYFSLFEAHEVAYFLRDKLNFSKNSVKKITAYVVAENRPICTQIVPSLP